MTDRPPSDADRGGDDPDEVELEAMRRAMRWGDRPGNPRTYPSHPITAVQAAMQRSEQERRDLEAMMAGSGQTDALVVAPLELHRSPGGGAHTSVTWVEGRITVLEPADVVVLFAQPTTLEADATVIRVRWDVAARICGAACWRLIAGIEGRFITSRWPSPDELDAMGALSLPELGASG